MGSHQPIRKIVSPEIPDKLYFRIGDVAKICDVPAYVLRFWETEFPQLKPNKGGTGQRLYRKRDVEMALRVKSLLYDQGYTIPGARQVFKAEVRGGAVPVEMPAPEAIAESRISEPRITEAIAAAPAGDTHRANQLQSVRNELNALLGMLSRPIGSSPAGPAKVKTMRPRLTLEPRPQPVAVEKPEAPKPALLQLAQRDLFATDEPDPENPA
jgi:DNA-binding transcriptional MerR regulator